MPDGSCDQLISEKNLLENSFLMCMLCMMTAQKCLSPVPNKYSKTTSMIDSLCLSAGHMQCEFPIDIEYLQNIFI